MTKLPIKQYQEHTTLKIYGETNLNMILARSFQNLPSPREFGKFTNVGLPSSTSTLVVLTHEVAHPPKQELG